MTKSKLSKSVLQGNPGGDSLEPWNHVDDELESNFAWFDGKLTSGLSEPSDKEKQRRNFERECLESRFDAYMTTWMCFGRWSLEDACCLLAGIPIQPIARSKDFDDRAHIARQADYRCLLMLARTYPNLESGATPEEWIDWFNTSGVARQVSNAPKIAALHGGPENAAPPVRMSWASAAREIATEIHNKKPQLSVAKIAEKTHEEMTNRKKDGETGMAGRGGKVPSADTIKRHALVGIKAQCIRAMPHSAQ